MKHFKIVERAFNLVFRYRTLWIFGIILALVSGGAGGSNGGSNGAYSAGGNNMPDFFYRPPTEREIFALITAVIVILIIVAFLVILLSIIGVIARYVSETAIIALVDDYEVTGIYRSFGYGFRLGWSRSAWRLFLIDLLITLPTAVIFIAFILFSLSPLLLWATGNDTAGAIGTVMTVASFFAVILAMMVVAVALSMLQPFFYRACVLAKLGVMDAIRQGYAMVRANLKNVILMWLLLLVIQFTWGIITIPVAILFVMLGILAGAVPAILAGTVVSAFTTSAALPWLVGAVVGVPIGLLVIIVPLIIISGFFVAFVSSVWTLTYRELNGKPAL